MIDMVTFAELAAAANLLSPEEKVVLIGLLQDEVSGTHPTREQLLAELDALHAAKAFDRVDSLSNIYASVRLGSISDKELLAAIHEASIEWESDLEGLSSDVP